MLSLFFCVHFGLAMTVRLPSLVLGNELVFLRGTGAGRFGLVAGGEVAPTS